MTASPSPARESRIYCLLPSNSNPAPPRRRNSARAMNLQDSLGSITPGKSADLILLDRDVLTISPEAMRDTKVLWTMVAGKIVYRAK